MKVWSILLSAVLEKNLHSFDWGCTNFASKQMELTSNASHAA